MIIRYSYCSCRIYSPLESACTQLFQSSDLGFHSCNTITMKSFSCDTITSFRPVLIRRILRSSFGSRSRATFVARVASLVRFCWCGAFELKECKIVSVRRVAMFVGSRSRYATLHSHSLPFSKQTHPSQIISQLLGHINLMTKNGSIIIANDVSLDSFQVFDSNKSFFDFTLENGMMESVR